jgi:hypothetical protein
MNSRVVTTCFLVVICLMFMPARQAEAQDWEWVIAPYIWGADTGADLSIAESELGTVVSFNDLVDKLNAGFMGHFEGRKGKFGLFFDMVYMDLGDSFAMTIGPDGPGPVGADLTVDVQMKMGLYDLAGIYRLGEPAAGAAVLDLFLGARLIDIDLALDGALIGTGPGGADEEFDAGLAPSETDLLLGARVSGMFNERWHWKLLADFSTGGSDGTFNTMGAVGYTFGQNGLFSLDAGYRYHHVKMSDQLEANIPSDIEIEFSGPIVGFIFAF